MQAPAGTNDPEIIGIATIPSGAASLTSTLNGAGDLTQTLRTEPVHPTVTSRQCEANATGGLT